MWDRRNDIYGHYRSCRFRLEIVGLLSISFGF